MSHCVKKQNTRKVILIQHANQDSDYSIEICWLICELLVQADAHKSVLVARSYPSWVLPVWVLVVDIESLGGTQQLWKKETERSGKCY